jgi:hypothetical protein
MDAGRAVLGPADIDRRRIKVDLLPPKIDQFANPQRMPECHQDQQPITTRVAAVASGRQQLLNFAFRQVFALPIIGVLGATTANCRLFRPGGP